MPVKGLLLRRRVHREDSYISHHQAVFFIRWVFLNGITLQHWLNAHNPQDV